MASTPKSLSGRVVAISGAGRGIGRATARALAARGMRVAIGELDLAAAQQTAQEIGGSAIALPLDVTSRESFAAFLDETERQLGPVDVLINNAGIMPLGRVADESERIADLQIDVNIRGVMHGTKEIVPRFLSRGSGHIINIASTAGKAGFPGGSTYCGTKAFVVVYSEALRAEVRQAGIDVSCVMPAVVNTELASGLTEARGVKNIEPTDVAAAIVDALEHPHFDVYVPKSIGPINTLMSLLPRRARDGLAKALRADTILDQVDDAKRRAYQDRITQSSTSASPSATAGADTDTASKPTVEPVGH
jgi:NADP-dependent 3-hydroxy acid dehydrogenase YdfG